MALRLETHHRRSTIPAASRSSLRQPTPPGNDVTMKTLPLQKAFVLLALVGLLACAGPALAAEVGVRIRFGLTDKEPENWNGTVTAKPGKVVLLSGWRFEQEDRANGTEGWTASTRPVSLALRTNAQKAKAAA